MSFGGGILGWIIAGCAVVVLLILLLCNVTVIFDYNGEIYLRISYLFFTIVKIPAKKKKTRKKNKKAKKAAAAAVSAAESEKTAEKGAPTAKKSADKRKKPEKQKPKKTLDDIFALVRLVLDSLGKPLKRLLKRTRISHFSLNVTCGGDDAAKAALNYGRVNILVGNALGWIDR